MAMKLLSVLWVCAAASSIVVQVRFRYILSAAFLQLFPQRLDPTGGDVGVFSSVALVGG
jgi:hypothetical protein